ncbi:MAG: type II secretion system protein GspG [Nitrospinae bacterium]|nr:type II secretion system protein GspG [Nitrospinota bacterium]
MPFKEWIKGCVRGVAGHLWNERGQTSLTEAAAAIAVSLTLAASLAPVVISVGDDAKIARAKNDAVAVAKAIQNAFSDTKEWPVRSTAGAKVDAPIADAQVAVRFLRSGGPTDDGRNPNLAAGHPLGTGIPAATCAHLLNNHLVFDTETTACTFGTAAKASLKYREGGKAPPVNWKGPYINEVFQDPWGRNYIVLLKGGLIAPKSTAFTETTSTITGGGTTSLTQFYAWVLSAGPNGILETRESDSSIQGDDVGTVFAVINVGEASATKNQ